MIGTGSDPGSSLSMRSFAIDEPGSSVCELYATLQHTNTSLWPGLFFTIFWKECFFLLLEGSWCLMPHSYTFFRCFSNQPFFGTSIFFIQKSFKAWNLFKTYYILSKTFLCFLSCFSLASCQWKPFPCPLSAVSFTPPCPVSRRNQLPAPSSDSWPEILVFQGSPIGAASRLKMLKIIPILVFY